MDDATRYQREFDLLMQEAEAEATRRTNADRDAIWQSIEKSFNAVAASANFTREKREDWKKQILDKAAERLRTKGSKP